MEIVTLVAVVIVLAFPTGYWFYRFAFGYPCPFCKGRIRWVRFLDRTTAGPQSRWQCPSCRSKFTQNADGTPTSRWSDK